MTSGTGSSKFSKAVILPKAFIDSPNHINIYLGTELATVLSTFQYTSVNMDRPHRPHTAIVSTYDNFMIDSLVMGLFVDKKYIDNN